jgi:hypothetical protein
VPRISDKMQKLYDLREGLTAEIQQRERELDALRNRLKGIDAAIATISGVEFSNDPKRRNRRNVKKTVMDLIIQAADAGVTANEIVEQASIGGRRFDRPSVSSLLSRLKREGVLSFDGERYHLIRNQASEKPASLKIVGG